MDSRKNEQRRWRDLCELHGPAADDAAAQNVPGKGVRQLSTWSFIPTSKVDLSLIEFLIWYFWSESTLSVAVVAVKIRPSSGHLRARFVADRAPPAGFCPTTIPSRQHQL